MRSLAASLLLAGIWTAPALAQGDPHKHHHHHQAAPAAASASHSHDVGPAGATYDLRWLDAITTHSFASNSFNLTLSI